MSTPRSIHPQTTWFVTRRTTRRHFLLHPDAAGTIKNLYWYTTAIVAAELGIQIHAVQVLSTHIHEVLTDTRGELPRFLRERNRLLANALKCSRGWPEEVFSRAPTNCVRLYGAAAVAKEVAYTLANCVEAGLVHHPREWPGVSTSVSDMDQRVFTIARPKTYFDPMNPRWPTQATIAITMPDALLGAYPDARTARLALRDAVELAISVARASAKAAGRIARGLAHLLRVSHHRRASTFEMFGKRAPSFAAAGDRELAARAIHERRSFLQQYHEALDRLKVGIRDVVFPAGTWRFHREFGFACHP